MANFPLYIAARRAHPGSRREVATVALAAIRQLLPEGQLEEDMEQVVLLLEKAIGERIVHRVPLTPKEADAALALSSWRLPPVKDITA